MILRAKGRALLCCLIDEIIHILPIDRRQFFLKLLPEQRAPALHGGHLGISFVQTRRATNFGKDAPDFRKRLREVVGMLRIEEVGDLLEILVVPVHFPLKERVSIVFDDRLLDQVPAGG